MNSATSKARHAAVTSRASHLAPAAPSFQAGARAAHGRESERRAGRKPPLQATGNSDSEGESANLSLNANVCPRPHKKPIYIPEVEAQRSGVHGAPPLGLSSKRRCGRGKTKGDSGSLGAPQDEARCPGSGGVRPALHLQWGLGRLNLISRGHAGRGPKSIPLRTPSVLRPLLLFRSI